MSSKNKGFTLIELIVVVTIMGIVAGLLGLSVSSINSTNAKRTSESINSLISKCRTGCLSREGNVYLVIYLDSDENIVAEYYENDVVVSKDTFTGKGTSVSYTTEISSTNTTLALEGQPLTLSFSRGTGSEKPQSDGSYCTAITFSSNRTYTITLVPSTGNHKLV